MSTISQQAEISSITTVSVQLMILLSVGPLIIE